MSAPIISVTLRELVLKHARQSVGERETTKNSSPVIDGWLYDVNAKPGDAWCVAWGYSRFKLACTELGDDHLPVPP